MCTARTADTTTPSTSGSPTEARYTDLGPHALVFPTQSGCTAYGAAQTVISRAMRSTGFEGVRVQDLRHTGQKLAAREDATQAGHTAPLRHSTVNGAVRYAHAADDHGRKVAKRSNRQQAKVARLQREARQSAPRQPSGTGGSLLALCCHFVGFLPMTGVQ